MKSIKEIAAEFETKRQAQLSQLKTQTSRSKENILLYQMMATLGDFLVDSLKTDSKREITNLPKVQEVSGQVEEVNSKKSHSVLVLVYDWMKRFKFPDVQKVSGEVTVKNQISIPDVKIPEYPKQIKTDVVTLPKYVKEALHEQTQAIKSIEIKPQVDVKVETKEPKVSIDLSELKTSLQAILESLNLLEVKPEVNIDLESLKEAQFETTKAIQSIQFPVPNFKSSWAQSLEMQSKDKAKQFGYDTVAGVKVVSTITFTADDGQTYQKTFSYTSNDPNNPDADSGWVKI